MKGLFERLLVQQRLVLLSALVLASIGLLSWLTMPRQEDPDLTTRWGSISVNFPGADAEAVERLVAEPLEEALEEVDEIRFIRTRATQSYAHLSVVLLDSVHPDEIEEVWKEIEDATDRAQQQLPAGASEPFVDKAIFDLESVVLAIDGSNDPLVLREAALRLRDQMLAVDGVSRVKLIGDPGDEIVIAYDDATAAKTGLSRTALTAQLQARNAVLPSGSVRAGDRRAALSPATEIDSVEDVAETPIRLPSGTTVPLGTVAEVRRGPAQPRPEVMRYQTRLATGLGIVPEAGGNVVRFGERLRERLAEIRPAYAPLQIHEVTFQPDRVQTRIDDLGRSLLISMLIVGGLLLLAMGVRMGLVVTAIVPLVALSALAVYAIGGGILHQMSVAALVIALGMLVDNAIVMAENVQRRLDDGADPRSASFGAVRELAMPLLTATGTTVAAFVPMLLAEGGVGEFTRAIPLLVTTVLILSFFYAVLVTPVVSRWVLRANRSGSSPRSDRFAAGLGRFAVRRPLIVMSGIAALLALVVSAGGSVEQNFFPGSDRNQVMVELRLPEGAHIDAIDRAAASLEEALAEHDDVASVATFVGRSAPHFYYNVQHVPHAPHVAQMIVTTGGKPRNGIVEDFVRDFAAEHLAGLTVVAKELEQGPGIAAPVEVRLLGEDLEALGEASETITTALKSIEGTLAVRSSLSVGAPQVRMRIDDAAAARHGVSRRDVAHALLGHTRGHTVGHMRTEDEPVEILVRSSEGEDTPIETVGSIEVESIGGLGVPLNELTHTEYVWQPAQYDRYKGNRVAWVRSNLESGFAYSTVVDSLKQRLPELDLPAGVVVEFGGEAEGADDANTALFMSLPIGLLLLVGFLMVEFNSYRRVAIVLATVPLAGVGIIPGLLIGDQPFGFMSLLGVIALAGVVVNNAIVMLDVVEQRRAEGHPIQDSLVDAVRLRLRPIALTTITTVAGLLPLALSGAALWPPLAWAMISGLLASTVLTLVGVPALYRLIIRSNAPTVAI